ncbi:SRPBCC family protein [Microbacterium sp. ASV49]|uniref:SRPBCC domain-containing protein n=1 Tax=Microbacterium candidum TaxID=3041922 RepID=A0ABT7N3Q3_9MICO|nr:SRPBCC domain-containing protein [Microbacterium sp. ASV49]MDL9981300.1 SRPBCC domain-containing protein [Microbacterium sp. ASV49]
MTAFIVSRLVQTDPLTAYDAWAHADRMREWWWPQWAETTYDLDVQQGGAYEIRSPIDGVAVSGGYTEARPGHVLAFTWLWDGESEADRVTVVFDPVDSATTEMTLVHVAPGRAYNPDYEQGWHDVLERFPASSDA